MGARVIYEAVLILAKKEQLGVVENVFLFNTPKAIDLKEWELIRKAAGGKVTNYYCSKDWLLTFLYRTSLCGTSKVGAPGVEDVEVDFCMHNCADLREVLEGVV